MSTLTSRRLVAALLLLLPAVAASDAAAASDPFTQDDIDGLAQEAYLKASNTETGDEFGDAVAISGDTLVVGVPNEDSAATGVHGNQNDNSAFNAGAAYVFVRSGTTWAQQAYLKASNTGPGDAFGISVAISGDTIVVGAFLESSNATGVNGNQNDNSTLGAGAAYVFVRSGTTWSQQAYLKSATVRFRQLFGPSVAISGNTIVVGAFQEGPEVATPTGAAFVFLRSGVTWSPQATLRASNPDAQDLFGWTVGISGDTIVVGAYGEDSGATGINGNQEDDTHQEAGAAYVFVRSAGTWSQQAYLKASNTDADDVFGWSVAIAGDTIAVGAINESSSATGLGGNQLDDSSPASGAVYVFERVGTTWSQQAYVKASNADPGDFFGWDVDIAGDLLVVGALGERSNATGVGGNQLDDSIQQAGAAYLFERAGASWSQQAYLKASNTEQVSSPVVHDQFGQAVSISGVTIAVGADREDSAASGVDGNQASNEATDSGAAYVFRGAEGG